MKPFEPSGSEAEYWRAQAERLGAENEELRGQVAALAEKVATLSRLLFGKSSEKSSPPAPEATDGADGGGPARRKRGQQRGGPGHGRRDYSHLPTTEEIWDLPEDERVCGRCGTPYTPLGEDVCEQIDWQVRVCRVIHRRPTYRRGCRCMVPGVLSARPVGKPIPKGRFTVGFLARLLVNKYVLGQPLHRISAALGLDGLDVADGTLVGVLKALSGLLAPLETAIRAHNAASGHLHADETSWQVFETVDGKANHRWWLWVFVGPDSTVFRIAPSRATKVLADHLGVDAADLAAGMLPDGRQLLLSSDFYTVYQAFGALDGVQPLWCWAHIRRYFIRAGDAHPALAGWAAAWTERIGRLYVAHAAMRAAAQGSPERARAQAAFADAFAAIDAARQAQASDPATPAAAAKVLATLDREWQGLARHEQYPDAPLDNNTAERALRNPVVGRKNYYGSGAVWAAELAGRAWTVTATAEKAGLNPLSYLTDYLHACANAGGRAPEGAALDAFLPWTKAPAEHGASVAGPQPDP
ncbi:MAG: IS66 family transposase [Egibacteraceae bacterium]